MSSFRDISGQRFGRVTAIEKFDKKHGGWRFRCLCDCGTEFIVASSALIKGNTKSCGCGHKSHKDISGQRFGRVTVIEQSDNAWRYRCRCDCGTEFVTLCYDLINGKIKSCGCYRRERARETMKVTHKTRQTFRIHGESGYTITKTYQIWLAMRQRCNNPNHKDFKHYGGRGIRVCQRWDSSYLNFLADMGHCPPGHSIERIDNDGNYEPNNCKWIPRNEQSDNRRITRNDKGQFNPL